MTVFKNLLAKFPHQYFAYLCCLTVLIGLVTSKAVMSIGMIALMANSVFSLQIRQNIRQFFDKPVYVSITLFFWICWLTGIYSENLGDWLNRLQLKLPFLGLPFAFAVLKPIPRKVYYGLLVLFAYLITGACLGTLWQYYIDYETINELFKKGHSLPTPVNHIRFSLMVVFAIFIMNYLFVKRFFLIHKVEPYLNLVLGIGLVIFLHILAARSGLVAFYLCCFYTLGVLVFRYKRFKMALLSLFLIGGFIGVAHQFSPTLQNKMQYTFYNFQKYQEQENITNYSDGQRLISIWAGIQVAYTYFPLGTGEGDIQQSMDKVLAHAYPELVGKKLLPHNQFVYMYAATGVMGCLGFCFVFFYPLYHRKKYRNYLFACFHLIILSSFITEHTLENQLGIAFYLLFLLLSLRFLEKAEPS